MAATTAMAAGLMVVMMGANADTRLGPPPDSGAAAAIHLTDDAGVSSDVMAAAKREVETVYSAAGVRLVWRDGGVPGPEQGEVFHVDLRLVAKDLLTRPRLLPGTTGEALGVALRPIHRIYVFYDPLYAHAMLTNSNVARLLAAVIAHEVGHLLLPAFSHSRSGIMRAQFDGPLTRTPGFTLDQSRTIRRLLTKPGPAA